MRRFSSVLAVGVVAVLAAAVPPKAFAGCDPGTKLDRSTPEDARKKMEAAGYRKVTGLQRGCDNAWHGKAVKDGAAVDVVLTPTGEVLREGGTEAYQPPR